MELPSIGEQPMGCVANSEDVCGEEVLPLLPSRNVDLSWGIHANPEVVSVNSVYTAEVRSASCKLIVRQSPVFTVGKIELIQLVDLREKNMGRREKFADNAAQPPMLAFG
jgi:hypothetical protein